MLFLYWWGGLRYGGVALELLRHRWRLSAVVLLASFVFGVSDKMARASSTSARSYTFVTYSHATYDY